MLKTILKILAALFVLLVIGIIGGYIYIVKFKPNFAVEQIKVDSSPEKVERGKYLAQNVARCMDCHSTRDWTKLSGPIVAGTDGKGGEIFDEKQGYPGTFYAPNMTPYHLKDWSDGEIFRAITTGESRDGHPLFPSMPYINYGKMDREDVLAIVAYIRSLPEIKNDVPASQATFPMSIFGHLIPRQADFSTKPAISDQLNYGKYLANVASCAECHTQTKRGAAIDGMEFAGGRYMTLPNGTTTVSSNITPDKDTGIGAWTEDVFVERFKVFDTQTNQFDATIKNGDFNTVMPWTRFASMTREDLAALYVYLKSLKPISNKVPKNVVQNH